MPTFPWTRLLHDRTPIYLSTEEPHWFVPTSAADALLELLQGKLSAEVMAVVAHRTDGLFPLPGEIKLDCSCPDWATMCKHVAAVLYGVGHRLDTDPGLLFTLRGVDAQELITAPINLMDGDASRSDTLADADLGDLFGIDLDLAPAPTQEISPATAKPTRPAQRQTTTSAKPAKAASNPRPPTTTPAQRCLQWGRGRGRGHRSPRRVGPRPPACLAAPGVGPRQSGAARR